jgi:hypothetical protein
VSGASRARHTGDRPKQPRHQTPAALPALSDTGRATHGGAAAALVLADLADLASTDQDELGPEPLSAAFALSAQGREADRGHEVPAPPR